MADQTDEKGIAGAHTQGNLRPDLEPDADQAAKIGDAAALGAAVLDDLANQIQPNDQGNQSSLFEDEDCLFSGPVGHVADTFEAAKGRGRPRGSKNKSNQVFRDYLLRSGYRHPGLNLADLANADPRRLAAELGCKAKEAMDLVIKANDILMPYFESKRPQEIVQTEKTLGVLVIESGAAAGQAPVEEGVYSLTGVVSESDDKSST